MHILSAYMKAGGGGAFILLERLLKRLSEEGHAVEYFAPAPFPSLAGSQCLHIPLPCPGSLGPLGPGLFFALLWLRAILTQRAEAGCVALSASALYAAAFSPLARKGMPVISMVHGNEQEEWQRARHPVLLQRALLRMLKRGFCASDLIIAVSRDLTRVVAETVPSATDKIVLQPNAVPELAGVSEDEVRDLRNALQLGDKTVLSFLGPLKRVKRIDVLLKALPIIRKTHRAETLVVGSGPEHDRLVALAESLGIARHVHFVGWQSDPMPYVGLSDIVILPSDYEGSPMALLEALGMNRVIVGSRVGGIPDIIENEDLMFAPGDHEGLAKVVLSALDKNGRATPGVRRFCEERARLLSFDWERAVIEKMTRVAERERAPDHE